MFIISHSLENNYGILHQQGRVAIRTIIRTDRLSKIMQQAYALKVFTS